MPSWILTVRFACDHKEDAQNLLEAFIALEPADLDSMVITEEEEDNV